MQEFVGIEAPLLPNNSRPRLLQVVSGSLGLLAYVLPALVPMKQCPTNHGTLSACIMRRGGRKLSRAREAPRTRPMLESQVCPMLSAALCVRPFASGWIEPLKQALCSPKWHPLLRWGIKVYFELMILARADGNAI